MQRREINVGRLFTLKNAPRREQDQEYLIVSADYDLQNNTYETGAGGEEATYVCTMSLLQSRQQFRPARITPRPTMGGPQTAVVVGPAGDEIYCDKYGRVKVQFHWDRDGKDDESSCWMRVSQPWAGKDWGTVSIPRIGQEVIVDFLEGDPDQPLIIGRVYNGDNMPPYVLPGAAVISGIKTKTHKGAGYNEISCDDTKGKEKITIHAQYDMTTTVEHDQTCIVHNNRTATIDVDDTEKIGGNQSATVGKDQAVKVAGKRTVTIGGADKLDVTGTETITVGGAIKISSPTSITLEVGGSSIKIMPGSIDITSAGPVTVKGAMVKVN